MINIVEQDIDNEKNQLNKKYGSILLGAILTAILYEFLFYDKVAGVSYPIFFFSLYAILYQEIKSFFSKKWCSEIFLMLLILTLSSTYLFFSNQVLQMINSILIPLLFVAHVLLVTEKKQ